MTYSPCLFATYIYLDLTELELTYTLWYFQKCISFCASVRFNSFILAVPILIEHLLGARQNASPQKIMVSKCKCGPRGCKSYGLVEKRDFY